MREIQAVSRGLTVMPLIALLIAFGAAMVIPAVVLAAGSAPDNDTGAGRRLAYSAFGAVAAALVSAGLAGGVSGPAAGHVDRCNPDTQPLAIPHRPIADSRVERSHVAVAALAGLLCVACLISPLDIPAFAGAAAIAAP